MWLFLVCFHISCYYSDGKIKYEGDSVNDKGVIDIGAGTEQILGVSPTRYKAAIRALENAGYQTYNLYSNQLGSQNQQTTIRVLAKPGMTQEEVASRIGVSRQKYARIENGSNNITLDILSKIASIFDVNVNDITSVLDEEPSVAYRAVRDPGSANKVFEMLDLFYANKHLYTKIKRDKKTEDEQQ